MRTRKQKEKGMGTSGQWTEEVEQKAISKTSQSKDHTWLQSWGEAGDKDPEFSENNIQESDEGEKPDSGEERKESGWLKKKKVEAADRIFRF